MPPARIAWCPGGRTNAYPLSTSPATIACARAVTAPTAIVPISYPPLASGVSPSPASPPSLCSLTSFKESK